MFGEGDCSAACVRMHQKVIVRRSGWLLSCWFEKLEVEVVMNAFRKERLRQSSAHTAFQACIQSLMNETIVLSIVLFLAQ